MREIIFRGKRTDNNEWVYGDLFHTEKDFKKVVEIIDFNKKPYTHIIDSSTVGQFTGLTDKNGSKIFEGDIIVMDEYPFYDNGVLSYVGEVVWFENTFSFGLILNCVDKNRVGISNGVSEDIEDDMVFEVIGNIHDNPEPIKE